MYLKLENYGNLESPIGDKLTCSQVNRILTNGFNLNRQKCANIVYVNLGVEQIFSP